MQIAQHGDSQKCYTEKDERCEKPCVHEKPVHHIKSSIPAVVGFIVEEPASIEDQVLTLLLINCTGIKTAAVPYF
jgi:hypothetical protein